MKRLIFIIILMVITSGASMFAQEQASKPPENGQPAIAMYYFHTSFRCTTCRTVEAESEKAFESLFPEQLEKGTAFFKAVNIDEEENAELVKKYQIAGQTLLLVKGDKTSDLTSQGFLYAKTKPEKLKEEIRLAYENL